MLPNRTDPLNFPLNEVNTHRLLNQDHSWRITVYLQDTAGEVICLGMNTRRTGSCS